MSDMNPAIETTPSPDVAPTASPSFEVPHYGERPPTPMPSMAEITREYAPVWDISQPEPVKAQLSHDMVEDGVKSGLYSFDKQAQVPVFNPKGELVTLPGHEFEQAIGAGYKYATPHAINQHQYGGAQQQAIAGLEGLAQGLVGPLAPMTEVGLGLTSKEAILGRKEANPITHGAAELTGFAAPLIATLGASGAGKLGLTGVAKGLEAASNAAKLAPLSQVATKAAAVIPEGTTYISRIPLSAVRGAIEGAIFQGSEELTKAYLDDPTQTAESVLPALGLAAVMGGAFSGGFTALGEGYGGLKKLRDMYLSKGEEAAEAAMGKGAASVAAAEGEAASGAGSVINNEAPVTGQVLKTGKKALEPEHGPDTIFGAETRTPQTHPEDFIEMPKSDAEKLHNGDTETMVKYDESIPEEDKRGIFEGIRQAKPNAEKLEGFREEYAPEVPFSPTGVLSRNKLAQQVDQAYSNTLLGQKTAKAYEGINNAIRRETFKVLGDGSEAASKIDVGEGILDRFNTDIAKVDEINDKMYGLIREHQLTVPLSEAKKAQYVSEIEKAYADLELDDRDLARIKNLAIKNLNLKKNANGLKELKTYINNNIPQNASKNVRNFSYTVSSIIRNAEHDLIDSFAKQAALGNDALKFKALRALREETDSHFKDNIEKYGKLKEILGNRTKTQSFSDIKDIFSEHLSPDRVIDRLGRLNYHDLVWFKNTFPEEFDAYRRYYLSDLVKKSKFTKDQVRVSKIFEHLFGRPSDARKTEMFLTDPEIKLLRDMREWDASLPPNFNPSGTASMTHVYGLLNPLTWKAELAMGVGRAGFLKAIRPNVKPPKKKYAHGGMVEGESEYQPHDQKMAFAQAVQMPAPLKAAQQMGQMIVKGDNMIRNSVKSLFDPGKPHAVNAPHPKNVEKLKSYVKKAQQDPSFLFGLNNAALPEFNAPIAASAAKAVNYISSLEPKEQKPEGLFSTNFPKPKSKNEDKYNKVLNVAEQPLYVLNRIKSGMVTPEEIGAVKNIYPQLYQNLSNKITEQLIEAQHKGVAIPYRTKIGLSMFLGQPLDSTMRPQAILAAQPKPSTPQQQQATQPSGGKHTTKPLTTMANLAKTPGQNREEEQTTKH